MNKYTVIVINKARGLTHITFGESVCLSVTVAVAKHRAVDEIGGVFHNWDVLYSFKGHPESVTEEQEQEEERIAMEFEDRNPVDTPYGKLTRDDEDWFFDDK